MRKIACLADFSLIPALKVDKPGAEEGDLWRALVDTVHEVGNDGSASENILASGDTAVLTRYAIGRTKIERQARLDHGAAYKHCHIDLMHTIPLGGIMTLSRHIHEVHFLSVKAAVDAVKLGREIGDVFEAYDLYGC